MIPVKIEIKDRGPTPRGMKRILGNIVREVYFEMGAEYHARFSDRRFTHAHAREANYAPRSKKYEQEKFRRFGHTYPLEFSGRTRLLVRHATISSTKNGVSVRYPGASVFNFKNPKMRANMSVEFTTVLQSEANELAAFFNRKLEEKLNNYNGVN